MGEVFAALYPIAGVAYILLKRLARADRDTPVNSGCDLADVPIAENEFPFASTLTVNVFGGIA